MPLSASGSRLAILVWAALWLPGLAVACWRTEKLLRAGQVARSLAETLALLAIPALCYGAYALSDAQRYAQAHDTQVAWSAWLPAAFVALPYAVGTLYLAVRRRQSSGSAAHARWGMAVLLGLLAVLLFAPGLLMTQLMVLVGA